MNKKIQLLPVMLCFFAMGFVDLVGIASNYVQADLGLFGGFFVAPSDIISNLFLEDLERIWELKKWIPDPCNPHLHYLKQEDKEK